MFILLAEKLDKRRRLSRSSSARPDHRLPAAGSE